MKTQWPDPLIQALGRRVWLAVILVLTACRPAGRPTPPPTVVLVSVDTLRADRLGFAGAADAETPVLDALARESLVFETAWSPVPLTLPAHASLFTGLLPPRHGVRGNGVHRLGPGPATLAEALGRAGFRTGAFIGGYPLDHRFGLARGFDHYDDALGVRPGGFYYPERRGADVVASALAWLSSQPAADRVFLFVHLYDPHAEYAPPAPFAERFAARPYDGEVAYVDSVVGRLREGLTAQGRWSDAVVCVVADHGESLGEHGEATHGLLLYEAALRVPFLVRAPGLAAGRRREPVSLVDVMPTLLALLGLPAPPRLDGRDVAGSGESARDLYAETLGPWLDHGWSGLRAVRRGSLKLVVSGTGASPELFDLTADPAEAHSVWPAKEGEVLEAALRAVPVQAVTTATAPLDPTAREALASLGYLAGRSDVPADFGGGGPDPRRRMDVVRELEAASSLAEADPPAALSALQALARRDPANNLIWRRLAALRSRTGDPEGAIAAYREAGRAGYRGDDLALALAEAHRRAGERRAEKGDVRGAERFVREAMRLDPSRAEAHHALGVVLARAGRFDEAIAAFGQANALDPGLSSAWFSLGLAQERRGRRVPAVAAYRRYLALDPKDSPETRHARTFVSAR